MKYFSKKVTVKGETFDSKAEYYRWLELNDMQKKGKIKCLDRQVRYEILPAIYKDVEVKLKTKTKVVRKLDERAKHYTADFIYFDDEHGYVEDLKSEYTRKLDDYKLRRHLMKRMLNEMNEGRGYDYWVFVEKIHN